MQTFKLFVSSPGDVMAERRRVENVASRLNGEFAGVARLEVIRWETRNYQAFSTFQAQIPRSIDCDLVVGILKWRLGTELPPDFAEKLPDGQSFPSGTAYEILTAIEKRQKGHELPDIYVFRFAGSSPAVAIEDPNRAKVEHDWQVLKGFFQDWFLTAQGHFKAAFNPYHSEDDFEAQLEKLLRNWVAEKVTGSRAVQWPIEVKGSPFCGLAAFGARHAQVFFGRGHDTARAVDLWRDAGNRNLPYLLVIGASGSGKSSLAQAGLVPRLTTPGVIKEVDVWRVAVMRPSDSPQRPIAALAAALMQSEAGLSKEEEGRGAALPEIARGDSRTPADLASVLSHANTAAALRPVVNALDSVAMAEHDGGNYSRDVRCDLVLLIDQLDELFAGSVHDADRDAFLDLVAAMVATGRIWVVTTLRADLYPRMLGQPTLKKLKELGATYDLAPPGPVEMAEIVRSPAEAAGLVYEMDAANGERLDARLLRDAEQPDMLPLVQLALSRLFEGRQQAGGELRLPLAVYEGLGGLKGIIDEAGERAIASVGEAEQARLPRLLRQLAVPARDQGMKASDALTARAVPLAEAAPDDATRRLLDALVTARLLTVSGNEADARVRLAHQRVLEDWERARDIIDKERDFFRIRGDAAAAEQRWRSQQRDDLLLGAGLPLAEAQSLERYRSELDRNLIAFIEASARYHEAEADKRRRQEMEVQANLLAQVGESEYLRRHLHTGLKLCVHAARQHLRSQEGISSSSRASATLAAVVSQTGWRLLLGGHENYLQSAAFSPDGARIVTASVDDTARIWDVANGKEITVLRGHEGAVRSAAFSPDGARIVTASDDKTARIWDAATGKEITVLRGHEDRVLSAAFSPDGARIVTASSDNTARIWDAATGKDITVLRGHEGNVLYSAAFSPDGARIVTASSDNTARIWDAATGKEITVLRRHESFVQSAAFSPDGTRIVTASDDKTARIWDAANGKEITVLRGHEDRVFSAAFSPDGARIVTASWDNTARIWDAATGKEITVLRGHESQVWSAAFSPDGARIVTASVDDTARIWDAANGKEITVLRGHQGDVRSAAFSPDGARIVTASWDNTARIWDVATGKDITVLRGHEDTVRSAAFSPDGARIVTASDDKSARIWDAATGNEITVLRGHQGDVLSAAFSPDGTRIVTASWDKTARIWDAANGEGIRVLREHQGVWSAAFSPDGARIVTASWDKTARIWDAANGKEITVLRGHQGDVRSAAFSPDGARIVTASWDNTARIWDVATGKDITVLRGHEDTVRSAAFSPDGARIVTASDDKSARIWDAATGKEITVLRGHEDPVLSAAFSPDGRRIVTASWDNTARIWDSHFAMMPTQDLIVEVCTRRLRGLTRLNREEMRLAGYPDDMPEIDVGEGIE